MNLFSLYLKHAKVDKNTPVISAIEIKSIRKSYNLSQDSFARMLDISVRTLQNYEIGKHRPSLMANSLFVFVRENPTLFRKYIKANSRCFVQ